MLKRIVSLQMIAVASLLLSTKSKAADLNIFEVRRNIPLADNEPVYKDFYINIKGNSSLKPNLVVTASRKLNLKDASGTSAIGELKIPVGQLKIIAVQGNIAVAREYQLISREEQPMLEQTGIMIGDQLDLEGAFVDTKKKHAEKRQPQNTEAKPEPKLQDTIIEVKVQEQKVKPETAQAPLPIQENLPVRAAQ